MTFADIGVKQIQTYLARSRHLWGRRGASEELIRQTKPEQFEQSLAKHRGVTVNLNAPMVDSVVNLEGPPSETRQCAKEIAAALKKTLPEITVEVSIHDVDSYVQTWSLDYRPAERWTYLPGLNDYPPGRLCEECGRSPASVAWDVQDQRLELCEDCAMRVPNPRRWRTVVEALHIAPPSHTGVEAIETEPLIDISPRLDESHGSHFAPEVRLLGLLNRLLRQDDASRRLLSGVKDFTHLAKQDALSTRPRTVTDNHLALVFADANRLGGLFGRVHSLAALADKEAMESSPAEALESRRRADLARDTVLNLSEWVKEVTWRSLVVATRHVILPDDTICPVIPHVVGGDDVTVSVTATRAWPFVEKFLETAESQFLSPPPELEEVVRAVARPSMSAGIVICQAKFPFGSQVELADEAMALAKKSVRGAGASISWHDVTWEGNELVEDRVPWTLQELKHDRELLTAAFDLPGATRDSLRRAAAEQDAEVALLQLGLLAHQNDAVREILILAAGTGWEQLPPEPWDRSAAERLRLRVRDVLSLTRWWSPWSE